MATTTTVGTCCCSQDSCSRWMFFSYWYSGSVGEDGLPNNAYTDSTPPGHTYADCPNVGYCPPTDFQPENRSCCDGVLTAKLYSLPMPASCKTRGSPKARIYGGSALDDYGTIGGVATSVSCGMLGQIEETTVVDADEHDGPLDTVRLSIDVSVTNSPYLCGPYGCAGVSVEFFYEAAV